MFAFLDVPVSGAYQLVTLLAAVVDPALAIVAFTVLVRLLLHPLARAAARGERSRAALAPQVRELQRKHGKDKERLQRELTALYRDSGSSMFAGCLPMLVQLPFFMVMYRLFSSTALNGHANDLLGRTLFGSPLGLHWFSAPADPVFLVLFAALAVVAWFSMRLLARSSDPSQPVPGAALLRLLPFGSVLGAAFIPLAAGVYLLTTTAWATAERAYLRRNTSEGAVVAR